MASMGPHQQLVFDSKEEAKFYQQLLPRLAPDRNLYSWTTPQVSVSFLTNGAIEAESAQSVDFLIAHPSGFQVIVEIDGKQHDASQAADQLRDALLQGAGFPVIRIPAKEVGAGSGTSLSALHQLLQRIPAAKAEPELSKPELALCLERAASRIQIALLQAARTGHLKLAPGGTWSMSVTCPEWCPDKATWNGLLRAATDDFVGLLRATSTILQGKPLVLEIRIPQGGTSQLDAAIVFGGEPSEPRAGLELRISDLYLPHSIEHRLASAAPQHSFYPDHDEAEYLLNFIFRKEGFREGQWEAISRALEGRTPSCSYPPAPASPWRSNWRPC